VLCLVCEKKKMTKTRPFPVTETKLSIIFNRKKGLIGISFRKTITDHEKA
jgi:hypothetical protein